MPPEALDRSPAAPAEADPGQALVDPLAELGSGRPVRRAPEGEVVAGGQVLVDGDLLRHHAETALDLGRLSQMSRPSTSTGRCRA
jgi:hypothetical protein